MKNWSTEEDAKLRELKQAKLSYPQMALEMGRTASSLAGRWFYLNRSPEEAKEAHRRRKIREAGGAPATNWNAEEDAKLRKLRSEGLQFCEIAPRMSRSVRSVYSRWQLMNLTPAQKEARKKRKNAWRKTAGRIEQVDPGMVIPPQVLIERDIRLSAPKPLSAWIFGDPPFCQSALAQRGEA